MFVELVEPAGGASERNKYPLGFIVLGSVVGSSKYESIEIENSSAVEFSSGSAKPVLWHPSSRGRCETVVSRSDPEVVVLFTAMNGYILSAVWFGLACPNSRLLSYVIVLDSSSGPVGSWTDG